MKRILISLIVAMTAFGIVMPVSAAEHTLSERLKGYFLLSVEDHGKIWFVDPQNGTRQHIPDAVAAWGLIKSQMVGISNANLEKIPVPGQAPKDPALRDALKGKFFLAVENHGEVWFVNPHTGYRHYLGSGEDTYQEVKKVSLGITLNDLAAIPTGNRSVELEQLKSSVSHIAYTDAELGWEFASTLWRGYEAYHQDFPDNGYPSTQWMENIFGWNLPMYLTEKGFTLDTDTQERYWEWSDFSTQFYAMYFKSVTFEVNEDTGDATLGFYLPSRVHTPTYGTIGPGKYYFHTKLGLLNGSAYAHLDILLEQLADTTINIEEVKSRLNTIESPESQMIYDFTKSIKDGMTKYKDANGHYLGAEWFENVFTYGLTTYLTEDGFTLDQPSTEVYWTWDNYSDEFFKLYFDHFEMFVDSRGDANFKMVLPNSLETEEYGTLEAGTYYFNSRYGFLTEAEYQEVGDPYATLTIEDVDVNVEAERIVRSMLALQEGLREYSRLVVRGYPELQGGEAIPLGVQGYTQLTEWYGFAPYEGYAGKVIMEKVQHGAPTTHIMYDSRLGGKSYIVTFELLGGVRINQNDYTAGKYEMTPEFGIQKVINLTGDHRINL